MNNQTLWVGAFRYYLGRMTYAGHDFCLLLINNWDHLDGQTQRIIKRELEEAIKNDDETRRDSPWSDYYPLGMDCDKASWLAVWEKMGEIK